MKVVTYTGRAGRYYVRDNSGKRHYFPRGVPVQVEDEVAALVPAKNEDLTVADGGEPDTSTPGGEAPDAGRPGGDQPARQGKGKSEGKS